MKINTSVRIKNKTFWVTFIPTVLILMKQIATLFGIEIDISGMSEQLVAIICTIFALLSILGVITDPTTEGISDSNQAMTYDKPKSDN